MIGLKDEYYEASRDRGGMQYQLLDGTTVNGFSAPTRSLPSGVRTSSPDLLNSHSHRNTVSAPRNAATIAYAVKEVMESYGRTVTRMEII